MRFPRQEYWSRFPFLSPGHLPNPGIEPTSPARLQHYVNRELLDVQAGLRKDRGTKDQIANIHWIIKKAGEFQRDIYFYFIDYDKASDCVDHDKLWILRHGDL